MCKVPPLVVNLHTDASKKTLSCFSFLNDCTLMSSLCFLFFCFTLSLMCRVNTSSLQQDGTFHMHGMGELVDRAHALEAVAAGTEQL